MRRLYYAAAIPDLIKKNMQKTVILIVLKLALLCSGIAAAQEKMTIHGMVQDTLGSGLSSVTVALYSA